MTDKPDKMRNCAFCGGSEHEREYLIAADGEICICEQCVEVCRDLIEKRLNQEENHDH